jgi:hypothetical protein
LKNYSFDTRTPNMLKITETIVRAKVYVLSKYEMI